MAAAAPAPRQELGADALAKLVVQFVLREGATPSERILGRIGHLLERVHPPELPADLCAELLVVGADQRPPEEQEVTRRQHVDGAPDDVREHDLLAVDRGVVLLARERLPARRERQQIGITGEGGRRARRGLGEAPRRSGGRAPPGRAGTPGPAPCARGRGYSGLTERRACRRALRPWRSASGTRPAHRNTPNRERCHQKPKVRSFSNKRLLRRRCRSRRAFSSCRRRLRPPPRGGARGPRRARCSARRAAAAGSSRGSV